jgi:hypothetical protein
VSDKDGKDLLQRVHDHLVSADAAAWSRYGQFGPFRLATWDALQLVAQKLGEFKCKRAAHAASTRRQDSLSVSTPSDGGTP